MAYGTTPNPKPYVASTERQNKHAFKNAVRLHGKQRRVFVGLDLLCCLQPPALHCNTTLRVKKATKRRATLRCGINVMPKQHYVTRGGKRNTEKQIDKLERAMRGNTNTTQLAHKVAKKISKAKERNTQRPNSDKLRDPTQTGICVISSYETPGLGQISKTKRAHRHKTPKKSVEC